MGSSASLPGFEAPAVGFEQPFEMLQACPERVQRSLALLERLMAHIEAQGHDGASRSAAADVLRYFDIAAPLHHEDEEKHVFPALRDSADTELLEAIATLQREHERMAALWQRLREVLLQWRDAAQPPPVDAAARALARDFMACYDTHIAIEEQRVYPAARLRFDAAGLARIGAEMQARRRGGA